MKWYKEANGSKQISEREMHNLRALVEKLKMGKRDWTPQDLQLQSNFPDVLEEMLFNEVVNTINTIKPPS